MYNITNMRHKCVWKVEWAKCVFVIHTSVCHILSVLSATVSRCHWVLINLLDSFVKAPSAPQFVELAIFLVIASFTYLEAVSKKVFSSLDFLVTVLAAQSCPSRCCLWRTPLDACWVTWQTFTRPLASVMPLQPLFYVALADAAAGQHCPVHGIQHHHWERSRLLVCLGLKFLCSIMYLANSDLIPLVSVAIWGLKAICFTRYLIASIQEEILIVCIYIMFEFSPTPSITEM